MTKTIISIFFALAASTASAQADPAMQFPPPYNELNCVDGQLGSDGATNWKTCHTTYGPYQMRVWAYKGSALKWTCLYTPAIKNVVVNGRNVPHTYLDYSCS